MQMQRQFLLLLLLSGLLTAMGLSGYGKLSLEKGPSESENTLRESTAAVKLVPTGSQVEELLLKRGMGLEQLLVSNDVPTSQVQELVSALRTVYNPRRLKAGEIIKLRRDASGTVDELRYDVSPTITLKLIKSDSSAFVAITDTLPMERDTYLLRGAIETSLYEAVLASGENPELIMRFTDIFQWDIDFFLDPRVGDRFTILYEKRFAIDPATKRRTFIEYGPILAAAYIAREKSYVAYGYADDKGIMHYYDEEGRNFQKTFLRSPLNYRRISSSFTTRRWHPILKKFRAHTGVDFSAPTGTPIVAAANGTVIHVGWLGGYGHCVKISHGNGKYVTLYGHMSRYAGGIRVGTSVSQNQVIGYVGATGLATGPHLHYTMYVNGRPVDPLKLKPVAGEPIAEERLAAFMERKNSLELRLGLPAELQRDRDAFATITAFAR